MKKLLLVYLITLGFTSCEIPTVNNIKQEDKIPNVVYQALDDTTQKPKYIVVETSDQIYLIDKSVDKKHCVEKSIDKTESMVGPIILAMLCIFFILLFVAVLNESTDI